MNRTATPRYIGVLAAFVSIVLCSSVASAATFAGAWSVKATLGRPTVELTAPTCVFRQAGFKIAGTCKGPSAAGPAVGTVNGWAVVWEWHKIPTNRLQINSIATYRGVFGPNGSIRGTWTDSIYPRAVGTFVGGRVR